MVGLRSVASLCLLAVRAAGVDDGSYLLQAHTEKLEAVLDGAAKEGAAAGQVPLPPTTGGGTALAEGMTKEDFMAAGIELLGIFQNRTNVGLMKRDQRTLLTAIYWETRRMGAAAKTLEAAAANTSSKAEVLTLLKDYFKTHAHDLAQMAAAITSATKSFSDVLQPEGKLIQLTRPTKVLGMVGQEQVAGIVENFLVAASEDDFSSARKFCHKLEPLQANLTKTANFVENNSTGLVSVLRAMLPRAYPVLAAFSPDAAKAAFWFANTTLDDITPLLSAAKEEVPVVAAALTNVGTQHLGCKFKEQSGASPLARTALSFILAAASALAMAA